MQRLCSWDIFCCLAFLLTVQICSNKVEFLATALCDNNSTLKCSNLNISAPFWNDTECAASENFVISNCSSERATWDAFGAAVSDNGTGVGVSTPPDVMGIFKLGVYTYINLTWTPTRAMNESVCGSPFSSKEVDSVLPDVIDLTSFGNGSVLFSSYNYYLLLNCANLDNNPDIAVDSPLCAAYKEQCDSSYSCAHLRPFKKLALRETLENLSCSHFMFLATSDPSFPVPQWRAATVQLSYGGAKCQPCFESGGVCSYNLDSRVYEGCICGANNSTDSDCNNISKGCDNGIFCNTAAKVGISVSLTVLGTVAFMLLLLWVYHKKKAYSTKSFTTVSSNRLLTQRAYMLSKKFGPVATKEFSFDSLSKATESFADENMIGDGGFGAVYLGILKDSRKVAVKRLYHDNFRRMDHFYNEIKILSSLDHPNLVKLYGFCCQDSSDLLLVFEYAAHGTVSDQLHDSTKPAMPWKTRLNIARETAEALSYLHNSVRPPIYHRDVKTTNILLDENLHAKLADFGLSRLVPLEVTHVSTAPQGTPGYVDPEYHQCYQLTDKSDVYSFGVVLMELVSAKLAVDMSRDKREINLSSLALMKIGCGMWEDLVDPRLQMKKNPEVEMMVKRVVELAFMCLHAEKDSRPNMEYVAETLSKLCQDFGYGDKPERAFSFRVDPPLWTDETSYLMRGKSASKSKRSANLTPSSSEWSSSNTSLSSANGT